MSRHPAPSGCAGSLAAKTLGLPLVGSYHTELGPYALHSDPRSARRRGLRPLRRLVLSPGARSYSGRPAAVADALLGRKGLSGRRVSGTRRRHGSLFTPARRDEALRARLLAADGQRAAALRRAAVGREARRRSARRLRASVSGAAMPGARLVLAGEGPSRCGTSRAPGSGGDDVPRGVARRRSRDPVTPAPSAFCFPSTTDTFGQVYSRSCRIGAPRRGRCRGRRTRARGTTDAPACSRRLTTRLRSPRRFASSSTFPERRAHARRRRPRRRAGRARGTRRSRRSRQSIAACSVYESARRSRRRRSVRSGDDRRAPLDPGTRMRRMQPSALFLPGWGAPVELYEPGLAGGLAGRSSRRASPPRAARSRHIAAGCGAELRRRRPLAARRALDGRCARDPRRGGARRSSSSASCSSAPAGLPLAEADRGESCVDFVRQVGRGVVSARARRRARSRPSRVRRGRRSRWRSEVRGLDLAP